MLETLRADAAARVCRWELWDINHMSGWQREIVEVAKEQPVVTAEERAQALLRWSALPQFVDQEIQNARAGVRQGYSAPKPVVQKVMKQVEGLLQTPPETSSLFSPAERSTDREFQVAYSKILAGPVASALSKYLRFLEREYLPKAREKLGISAHPDGQECYRASLRQYTTIDRDPTQVFELGQETVATNTDFVLRRARQRFGTKDLPSTVRYIKASPANRFTSEARLIDYSRDFVAYSRDRSRALFLSMPSQEMRVEPFEGFMRGSGVNSFYDQHPDPNSPAYYRINSEVWPSETRGAAEITAVHEGYPGHHMQIAFANSLNAPLVLKITANSSYMEGWARYAESLAEEAGIYRNEYALLTRRLWPARGMVADPGLHLLGWSREQVVDFLSEAGRFSREESDGLVDRMAVWPGQLAAYDVGALEILALRAEAKRELGSKFDIREFHQRVLENGSVPLSFLGQHIRSWVTGKKAGADPPVEP